MDQTLGNDRRIYQKLKIRKIDRLSFQSIDFYSISYIIITTILDMIIDIIIKITPNQDGEQGIVTHT